MEKKKRSLCILVHACNRQQLSIMFVVGKKKEFESMITGKQSFPGCPWKRGKQEAAGCRVVCGGGERWKQGDTPNNQVPSAKTTINSHVTIHLVFVSSASSKENKNRHALLRVSWIYSLTYSIIYTSEN